jgi:hypothetical protein
MPSQLTGLRVLEHLASPAKSPMKPSLELRHLPVCTFTGQFR